MSPQKSRTFQVYNASNRRWVKFDRELGRIVACKKSEGPYANVPKYRRAHS